MLSFEEDEFLDGSPQPLDNIDSVLDLLNDVCESDAIIASKQLSTLQNCDFSAI